MMPSRPRQPVRALVAALVVAGAGLATAAPPVAAAGLSCPDYYTGRGHTNAPTVPVGLQMWFQNNYTDFGQPGTVHAVFTGPQGRTREATANNLPDGAYFFTETFHAADVGRWHVAITIDEVGGHADCTATFRVVAVGSGKLPDTATAAIETATSAEPVTPAGGLLLAAGVLGGLLALRRRAARR